jgi:alpha-N-arabinofuranosidase
MEGTKKLGVSVLRRPGGTLVSGCQWKDGIGPKDQRPARPDHAWGGVESNRFGADEFLPYCGTAALGEINQTRGTDWADQRRKNVEDYTKFALAAAKAMRRVDDSLKLIASGSSNFRTGADWAYGWATVKLGTR